MIFILHLNRFHTIATRLTVIFIISKERLQNLRFNMIWSHLGGFYIHLQIKLWTYANVLELNWTILYYIPLQPKAMPEAGLSFGTTSACVSIHLINTRKLRDLMVAATKSFNLEIDCCDSQKSKKLSFPLPSFSEHHHLFVASIGITILFNCFT